MFVDGKIQQCYAIIRTIFWKQRSGSAYKIAMENEKMRRDKTEKENSTSEKETQTDKEEKEQITKVQTVLRVIKKMRDGETQTGEQKTEIETKTIKEEEGTEVNDQHENSEGIFEKFCRNKMNI